MAERDTSSKSQETEQDTRSTTVVVDPAERGEQEEREATVTPEATATPQAVTTSEATGSHGEPPAERANETNATADTPAGKTPPDVAAPSGTRQGQPERPHRAAELPEEQPVSEASEETLAKRKEKHKERRMMKRRQSWGWRIARFVFHLLWFPALSVGGVALGLYLGYHVIGGEPAEEVFSRELWQHLYDLVYKDL